MRIISYNVNGIRAAINKGLMDWLKTNPADVICVQETKAAKENVDHTSFNNLGYEDYWFSAQKKGYSGVAVFTRVKPDHVEYVVPVIPSVHTIYQQGIDTVTGQVTDIIALPAGIFIFPGHTASQIAGESKKWKIIVSGI